MEPLFNLSEDSPNRPAWFGSLSRLLQNSTDQRSFRDRLDEQCVRVSIMLRARWLMLALLWLYVLFAVVFVATCRY